MIYANPGIEVLFPDRAKKWKRSACICRILRHGMVQLKNYSVPAATEGAKGKRIAFFSDLHFQDDEYSRRILAKTLKILRGLDVEFLMLGGDMIGDCGNIDCLSRVFADIKKSFCGEIVAVLGNHERSKKWINYDFWNELYQKNGINLLRDEFYRIGNFNIFGKHDRCMGDLPCLIHFDGETENLLLTHNPDTVFALDTEENLNNMTLALVGHTHGGQLRIPGKGALLAASRYGAYYDYGMFRRKDLSGGMIISSGLGKLTFPIRVNCPPEILQIDFI